MTDTTSGESFLGGIRIVELADELGEYCGKVLAGLGAEVVKVEPPAGEATRGYGPFYHDEPHPDRSLHFWHYNLGKRSVTLDLDTSAGAAAFGSLARSADVVIDTRPRDYLKSKGIGYEELSEANPGLIYVRISAFGDDGPWADYRGSDLVHLALGGVMMNCGYDPDTTGFYDTPPVAPQMWQAYHIAGEVTAVQIMAALAYRCESGVGQQLSASVHDAVSKNTEQDVPNWIYARLEHCRQTCKHSFPIALTNGDAAAVLAAVPGICRTKDGRWILPYLTYLQGFATPFDAVVEVLRKFNAERDLGDEKYQDPAYRRRPETIWHIDAVVNAFIGRFPFARDLWKEGQRLGLPWSPLRQPEENIDDQHWAVRDTFAAIDYPEVDAKLVQVNAKWYSPDVRWPVLPRAPLLGEHTQQVLSDLRSASPIAPPSGPAGRKPLLSPHGKPFALSGVRIVDLTWLLASAGAGRFFTAHGAEVIKVEHVSRVDGMRFGPGIPPPGGRAARDAASGPLSGAPGINSSGSFMDINAGKRSLSLNLKTARGKALLIRLIEQAEMVVEGFSPGTMERMGMGYERLRAINPRIIYVQQSGMGQHGTYGQLRSFGPTAQAFSGLSEMSGLPEPYAPAGIGYSYLDWFGAYQMAAAMMAALYRQRMTGKGCWIDSSQVETGLYLTGTAVLDYTANGRSWSRYGNRSPYKAAAPHGVYRTAGEDRWLAIAAFTDAHWTALTDVLGMWAWRDDVRFATLADRVAHQDRLDAMLGRIIAPQDGYDLMHRLQAAGVPAGVCQTAQDRCESDPQLRHLGWLVDLPQSDLGTWPVKETPVKFSGTPPFVGGTIGRHGPSYGEDNNHVLREMLGLSEAQIAELMDEGVL